MNLLRALRSFVAKWEESEHPREPAGSEGGGQFASAGGPGAGGDPQGRLPFHSEDDETRVRLAREWSEAKPRMEALERELTDREEPLEVATSGAPMEWDDVSEDVQGKAFDSWAEDNIGVAEQSERELFAESVGERVADDVKGDDDWHKEKAIEFIEGHETLSKLNLDYATIRFANGHLDIEALRDKDGKGDWEWDDDAWETLIEKARDREVESRVESEAQDYDPSSDAMDSLRDRWSEMDDESKFEEAKAHLEGETAEQTMEVRLPEQFDVLGGTQFYDQTRGLGIAMQRARVAQILAERGLAQRGPRPERDSPESAENMAEGIERGVWDAWKGSSTSMRAMALQVAAAEEMGAKTRMDPMDLDRARDAAGHFATMDEARQRLAVEAARRQAAQPEVALLTPSDSEIADAQDWMRQQIGMEKLRAYVRGTWETTQHLMERAGIEKLDLYRAIKLPVSTVEASGPVPYVPPGTTIGTDVIAKLPNLKLLRNGVSSWTADAKIANAWGGVSSKLAVDQDKAGEPDERVVLRAEVPRSAVLSLPVYGQNEHEEKEVVVLGTPLRRWDAWRKRAPMINPRRIEINPSTGKPYAGEAQEAGLPIAAVKAAGATQPKSGVVLDLNELDRGRPHWLSAAGNPARIAKRRDDPAEMRDRRVLEEPNWPEPVPFPGGPVLKPLLPSVKFALAEEHFEKDEFRDVRVLLFKHLPGQHDQESHGDRGGSPEDPSQAARIAHSLAEAGRQQAAHEKKVSEALGTLPDGYEIKVRNKVWTKQTISGDVFWIRTAGGRKTDPARMKNLTSAQLLNTIGGVGLKPHIGAEALGWQEKSIFKNANHRGVMVALRIPPEIGREIAVEGGEPVDDLHLTLAYLGDADEMEPEVMRRLHDAISALARTTPPLEGRINGYGRFLAEDNPSADAQEVLYASFDAADLPALRHRVVDACEGAGAALAGEHGFTPHITLRYDDPGDPNRSDDAARNLPTLPVRFERLSLVIAGTETQMRFQGDEGEPGEGEPQAVLPPETFSELMRAATGYVSVEELEGWASGREVGVAQMAGGLGCVAVKKGGDVWLAVEGYTDGAEVRADDLVAALRRIPHDFIMEGALCARDLMGNWLGARGIRAMLSATFLASPILAVRDLLAMDGDLSGKSFKERYELLRAITGPAGSHILVPPVSWASGVLAPSIRSALDWRPSDGDGWWAYGARAVVAASGYTHGPTGDVAAAFTADLIEKWEESEHPRAPAGSDAGGEFTGEGGGPGAQKPSASWSNRGHRTAERISGKAPADAPLRTIKVYHVTTRANAEGILRGGFDINRVKPLWMNDKAISTSRGLGPAAKYFSRPGQPFDAKKYAILEVTVRGRFAPGGNERPVAWARDPEDYRQQMIAQGYDGHDQRGGTVFIHNPKAITGVREVAPKVKGGDHGGGGQPSTPPGVWPAADDTRRRGALLEPERKDAGTLAPGQPNRFGRGPFTSPEEPRSQTWPVLAEKDKGE